MKTTFSDIGIVMMDERIGGYLSYSSPRRRTRTDHMSPYLLLLLLVVDISVSRYVIRYCWMCVPRFLLDVCSLLQKQKRKKWAKRYDASRLCCRFCRSIWLFFYVRLMGFGVIMFDFAIKKWRSIIILTQYQYSTVVWCFAGNLKMEGA